MVCILAHGSFHQFDQVRVLPIFVPGSEGWRSWAWEEALAVMAWHRAREFGNRDILFATLLWSISLRQYKRDLLTLTSRQQCDGQGMSVPATAPNHPWSFWLSQLFDFCTIFCVTPKRTDLVCVPLTPSCTVQ